MTLIQPISLFLLSFILLPAARADCHNGWSSCDSSIWVNPKLADEQPLEAYTPGHTRGPLEYEIKFSCRGRRAGYYADLDHGCKVWHYCNTTRQLNPLNGLSTWTYMHYSYACLEENTRYDQVLKVCIPESRALVGCRESELYYPTGEYIHDVPITIQSNNRLVPVRCPQSPVRCQVQKDHIKLSLCPEPPGAVLTFYSDIPSELPTTIPELVYNSRDGLASGSDTRGDDLVGGEIPLTESSPVDSLAHSPPAPSKVTFYNPAIAAAPAKGGIKSNDAGKTTAFRFRDTPAAAARKTAQAKGQSKTQPASKTVPRPPASVRRVFVVPAPQPVRTLVVTDLNQRVEQSKTRHAFATKTSAVIARKTIAAPIAGQVETRYYSQETRDDRTYPFIASNQFIFPRRLSEPEDMAVVTEESVKPAVPSSDNRPESAESDFLGLPNGSTQILGEKIDTSFECTGKAYGYYADVKNQCKMYHICSPKVDDYGTKFYEHFSFVCSEGLVFDQQKLTCLPALLSSTPCADSEKYFERTADIFRQGNENWLKNKNKIAPAETAAPAEVTSPAPIAPGPALADASPNQPILIISDIHKDRVSASNQEFPSPSTQIKAKASKTNPRDEQQEALPVQGEDQGGQDEEQDTLSSGRQVAISEYYAGGEQGLAGKQAVNNSANAQAHNPSIKQTIYRTGGARTMLPAHGQRIPHSPSLAQYRALPAQPSSAQDISHSPSITQFVSQPTAPSDQEVIAHNPTISHYISVPAAPAAGEQGISHNPSINQYVAGAGSVPATMSMHRISHTPTISQYVAQPAGIASFRTQTISHNPSIHQVISLPEYARPSGRRS